MVNQVVLEKFQSILEIRNIFRKQSPLTFLFSPSYVEWNKKFEKKDNSVSASLFIS